MQILHFGDELSDLTAQVNALVPPTPFLEHPGEPVTPFRTWIRIFNNYLLAAFPAKLSDERKQAILLNSLGVEGQRLFYALPPLEPTYEATLRALELFFTPKANVCTERHRFRSRHQLPNESVDHYVVSLRELVSLCAFGPLEDEMIRDQLIEGTSSPSIRERLISLCELTLETALTVARQMESAKKDAIIISTPEANVSVQMTKRYRSQNARRSNDRCVFSQRRYRCGSTSHLANYLKCPAKHAQCTHGNCRKMGHFAQVCRSVNSQKQSKTVHSLLSARASDVDRLYVHVGISSGSDSCAPRCMLDTGSPVSILPADIFRRYFPSVQLCKSTVSLVTYTKSALPTLGCIPAIVRYKGRTASTNFFVVPPGTPLLGTDLIGALKIAIRGMRVVSTLSTTFGPCRAISSTGTTRFTEVDGTGEVVRKVKPS
ncbi:hypothetical protein M513_07760 [Trichuris suis]|uniref:Retrotransposon gag domain-containing protein n=1 Tax=Trichuris suis TaxID=68888 RepID=A0A085M2A9_9BILA|nr:hypothetical protein M513_07760 [Trichuris suis]